MNPKFSGNSSMMRDMNRANILDLVRRRGPVSQAEMAKRLGVQPSTVLRLVKELEEEQLLFQSGIGAASPKGGRKAGLWELNPKGAYAIGVDLCIDDIITVLTDLTGNIIYKTVVACPYEGSFREILEAVEEGIERTIRDNADTADQLAGIGIGLPGRVDSVRGVSHYALSMPKWRDVPLRQLLEARFRLPVYIQGDMQAMALGETWYGAGREKANLLCLGLRKGVGLGVVIEGAIYKGKSETVGDLGHVAVEPNGRLCTCGRRGCLATFAGAAGWVNWLREFTAEHGIGVLNGHVSSPEEIHFEQFCEALNAGVPAVVERVRESIDRLGRALSDLVRLFDPEVILVAGSVISAYTPFMQLLEEAYTREQPRYADKVPPLQASQLQENSVALGASALVLSQYFRAFESARSLPEEE